MVSKLESQFEILWKSLYPNIDLEAEVELIDGRKYRFDYVHHQSKVAIEINGSIWTIGGHSSGRGLIRDYTKLNLAQQIGFCVFQLSAEMIIPQWVDLIARTIRIRCLEKMGITVDYHRR